MLHDPEDNKSDLRFKCKAGAVLTLHQSQAMLEGSDVFCENVFFLCSACVWTPQFTCCLPM